MILVVISCCTRLICLIMAYIRIDILQFREMLIRLGPFYIKVSCVSIGLMISILLIFLILILCYLVDC